MSSDLIREVDDTTFDSVVISSNIPVLVDFWAPWCGPCRALAPTIDKLAEERQGEILFCKVNVDESPDVAARYGIRGIPTLLYFRGGQMVNQLTGNVPKNQIEAMLV